MKKVITLFTTILLVTGLFAQAPEKMSYQAVIRDAGDMLVNNSNIGMQISILQGSADGTEVYKERHFPTTDANGLVTLEVGTGTIISGDFTTIDWSDGPYFIKTETDLNGGANYTITGTSQLLSVPYAYYAESTGETSPWISNGDDIYFDGDNIGIGTSNPQMSIDVRGAGTDDDANLRLANSDLSHFLLLFAGRENDPNPFIWWKNGDPFRFATDEGGWSEKMRIASDGKVGIGTTNPQKTLHVEGEVRIADGTEGENKVLTSDSEGNASWAGATGLEYSNDGNYVVWYDGEYSAQVLDSITMSIPQSGYVILTCTGYGGFFGQNRVLEAGIGTDPTTMLTYTRLGYLDGSGTERYKIPYSVTYVVEVSEGTIDFYAIGEGEEVFSSGTANIQPLSFTGIFIPNKY